MPHNKHDINLTFLQQKGFKTSTIEDLNKALHWLKTTEADCLMHGEGTGDPFDIMVGEMRRPIDYFALRKAANRLKESASTRRGKQ